jgi:hypothetical protein
VSANEYFSATYHATLGWLEGFTAVPASHRLRYGFLRVSGRLVWLVKSVVQIWMRSRVALCNPREPLGDV